MNKVTLLAAIAAIAGSDAFVPSKPINTRAATTTTELQFGIPTFQPKKDDGDDKKGEKKVGAAGLLQLITAGMGAPFLGDFQGVDRLYSK
jgi:hypothetical protein